MTVIAMSRTEIDRMSVLHDLADGRIRIAEASTLMGLGRRQVFPLTKAYGGHGPQVLVSRRRGRPSNRCYPTALRAKNWHHQAPPTSGCFQLVRYGVLEGMIHGLAVASSAVGGPGETLRDRETGLLFPPRDARALCAIDPSFATDSDLRSRMATAGAASVRIWLWPQIVAKMVSVYQEAIAQLGARGARILAS